MAKKSKKNKIKNSQKENLNLQNFLPQIDVSAQQTDLLKAT
jgi:hypothetical protein